MRNNETMAKHRTGSRVVVALGGNAITRTEEEGSVQQDYANLRRSLSSIVDLVAAGHEVVLTHGNGPQVGNQMIRVEMSRGRVPDLPLDIVVADLQGGLGYMIERVLRNLLLRRGLSTPPCTLLSLVEVDPDDPAMREPTKFVGPAYVEAEARALEQEHGWRLREDSGRGFRRVVPSPMPRAIIERDLIRKLVDFGALVIVTGGGGIPVSRSADGTIRGVEAVIDKDLVAALLAHDVDANELYILTSVEHVMLDFGTPEATALGQVTVSEMRRHLAAGQFPAGSMAPKVKAACRFVESGGERALITDIFTLAAALEGKTGTWITA
jgi:carbamate kinase